MPEWEQWGVGAVVESRKKGLRPVGSGNSLAWEQRGVRMVGNGNGGE